MSGYECDVCGLAECDLPDGVEPEFVFEHEGGVTFCVVHSDAEVSAVRDMPQDCWPGFDR